MTDWTAPAVTRVAGLGLAAEPELLPGLLDWHRSTLLLKCAGLSGDQLAQAPIAASNLTLLGLIRHLAKVERTWFRRVVGGERIDPLYSTPQRPDDARLLDEQEAARRTLAGMPLDTPITLPDGDKFSLRLVVIHMIGEYARHNGHADLIRQCVDGVTGA
jgi:uncharacterized damage-inducible protein DinB